MQCEKLATTDADIALQIKPVALPGVTCFKDVLDYPLIHNSIQTSIQAAENGLGFALMDVRYIAKRVDLN